MDNSHDRFEAMAVRPVLSTWSLEARMIPESADGAASSMRGVR